MDNQPILKKTLVTVAVMVGAWVAFVGTLAVVIVVATSHLGGAKEEGADEGSAAPHVGSRAVRDRSSSPPASPNPNSPRHPASQ